ncbi:MAG TPA: XdhC family protein [Aliiroseovarius sp.]|nr:XdhC family protein [Aliiroseovarius sp.]
MTDRNDMAATALGWHRDGRGAALATVVETWGSAPRPVGSLMAISGKGEIEGSVSGGCVEGAVVVEAQEALEKGRPKLLEFGVSDDQAFAAGLACGGRIRVLVEPVGAGGLPEAMLAELGAARAARRPVGYMVNTRDWTRRLVGPEEAPERFRADRSGFEADGVTFVAVHTPPLRLFVVGAAHIAQALVPMARLMGHDVTVIDPRSSFATPARFPDTEIRADYPDECVAPGELDARTALVTLAHDPKIDDPALEMGLRAPVYYLGALGSTRTHAKRVERLSRAGFAPDEIARIHAPVGLDIGSRSPAEIAVSVLAQMVQSLRRG